MVPTQNFRGVQDAKNSGLYVYLLEVQGMQLHPLVTLAPPLTQFDQIFVDVSSLLMMWQCPC
jgi:hypothetical protein